MRTLKDILSVSADKDALVHGCVQLIETHVHERNGIKGMIFRAGMAMLKKAKPGIIERATAILLPEFVEALEPLHSEFLKAGNNDFARFLEQNASHATQAMLVVADRHVAESSSATVKSTYARMRGDAAVEVQAVIPGIGKLISARLD